MEQFYDNDSLLEDGNATEYVPYANRIETYLVPVVFFLIFVVGILGNGTLVVIFLRHRTMRNVPNTYVIFYFQTFKKSWFVFYYICVDRLKYSLSLRKYVFD